jgi:CRISPR-associated endoribonuclease Cas6
MRLNLKLTASNETVPYNHLHCLTGFLHRCVGENALHDGLSLYSFGWLGGGQSAHDGDGLAFPQGAKWRLSFHEARHAKRFIDGAMQDPEVFCGMRVFEIKEQKAPSFNGSHRFNTDGAPVIARQYREDGSRQYLLSDDEAAAEVMTRVLRRKLAAAGYGEDHAESATVQFDQMYPHARDKVTTVKGTDHKGSICPVVVEGTPEAVQFAWTVGVGELTGSGFGALK